MVSFWPWKTDDSSPASFEKALSALSNKITKTTEDLDSLRQRSRRFGLLWTLYSTFTYLLYSIILVLVVGWKNWGPVEYAAVAGGPPVIYSVRLLLLTYYSYRTAKVQSRLDELEKQRNSTIEKLKAATKYNSTQELLKKYGGTPTPKGKGGAPPKQDNTATPKGGRTNVVPPPTANIPGRNAPASLPSTPQRSTTKGNNLLEQVVPHTAAAAMPPWEGSSPSQTAGEEFAPNAFPSVPQYSRLRERSQWYDRLVDALLGEDETLPKNRMALICDKCRLVNGQAPPGVKRLEDVGKWRCGGCGAMNGEVSEAKKIISSIQEQATSADGNHSLGKDSMALPTEPKEDEKSGGNNNAGHESDITQYSDSLGDDENPLAKVEPSSAPVAESEPPRRRSTRPKKGVKEK